MNDDLAGIFLRYSADKLSQLRVRIKDCLGHLDEEQVWTRGTDNENAVGNLVLHLCGNVRQWIGFGIGGLPDVRQRDSEFAARGDIQPGALAARLDAAVDQATAILTRLPAARLGDRVRIQKYDLTVLEAIYHVVEHFSQHTGQIIFATKQLTGEDLNYYGHLKKPENVRRN